VLTSNSHYSQAETSVESARTYLTTCSRTSDVAMFVVVFGRDDLPCEAYAVRRGVWRDLGLLKATPLPDDLSTLVLYSGNPKAIPHGLVTKWCLGLRVRSK
jgi:hypothetical protein